MAVAHPGVKVSEAEFINIHQKLELLWVLCKYFSGDDGEVSVPRELESEPTGVNRDVVI
jgi:hypothetical protein